MNQLKEYIKDLVRKELEEMSTTGGGEAYATPFAFAKKGQKKNIATSTAEDEGWKVAKKPTTSKIVDYKKIFEKMEIGTKIKHKLTGVEMVVNKLSGNTITAKVTKSDDKRIEVGQTIKTNKNLIGITYEIINESLENIIKEELLNEVTYSKFKSEVKFRTKSEQLHKAIREVKKKLAEIDRIVEYTSRMKQELSEGEEGIKYWKATQKNVAAISEMVNHLNNKIKNLNQ
jgi:hypothetical protein